MKESFEPESRKPRIIWSGRSSRRVAEPLPTQIVEFVFPQHAVVKDMRSWHELRREQAQQSQLPGMRGAREASTSEHTLPTNRLIWTNDNLVALTSLLKGDDQHPSLEGKVDLIYIDPPFAVQSDFKINIEIENGATDEKLPTLIEEIAYTDTWQEGLDSYLSMMRDRLELLHRLLSPTGSIFVHCDWHVNYLIRLLLDETFGREKFQNEIIWYYYNKMQGNINRFASNHDSILWYRKSDNYQFSPIREKREEGTVRQIKRVWDKEQKRLVNMKDTSGKVVYQETDERTIDDVWRLSMLQPADRTEKTAFPTQKPLALIRRILAASTKPGDLVLDAFAGSGTTAVAAETMKDADGKPAPRNWIAIDCGKFAIHITRKRLIEAGAQPFAVENVGFYARGREWKDLWTEQPSAKVYRDALVELYGGTPVEGYAHLHGRKGGRWVHVGPIDAPIAPAQVEAVVSEASNTAIKVVDILSADIPIDWNRSEAEERHGVAVYAKTIPAAAVEAVRDRLGRKRRKDAALEVGPPIHFFSPPDVEVSVFVSGDSVTVKLLRLTVDLEDCLSTQDPAKRAQIRERITDWRALVDYWAVDWDYREGEPFQNDWQTFRTRKNREIASQAAHSYGSDRGEKLVAVKVTDIFGNDGLRVARIDLS